MGRVRGRDFVRVGKRWASCKTVFRQATATPRLLGTGDWVRSNPPRALFVLVEHPPQGRRGKTAAGKRARSNQANKAARNAKQPWLLVVSPQLGERSAKQLVRLYRQRMQIEEAFRDTKSQHFGEGLERSRSRSAGRYTVLVLIGTAAIYRDLDQHLRPGSRKRCTRNRRVYSQLFLARMLLTLEDYRPLTRDLNHAATRISQWAADHHNGLFTEPAAAR